MPDIGQMVVDSATRVGVDPSLALAVAIQESGLNPNAISPAGAMGVMQLMPATAAALGVANPFDPTQNIPAGVSLLAQLLAQFGDPAMALAAYDWSPSKVSGAIASYGANWLAHAPAETQNYVASILGAVGAQASVAPIAAALLPTVSAPGPSATVANGSMSTADLLTYAGIGLVAIFVMHMALGD